MSREARLIDLRSRRNGKLGGYLNKVMGIYRLQKQVKPAGGVPDWPHHFDGHRLPSLYRGRILP
jgi:hypothetical protein